MPELIYLDQLHWINLSKARLGQEGTEVYADLLAELRAAVTSGRAVVPISFTHYFEVSEIARAGRRANLALTMGELSRYVALTPREVFLRHQFRRSLASELGTTYAIPQPPITGYGFGHVFGETPVLDPVRSNPEGTRAPLERAREMLNAAIQLRILMGPANKLDPELLKYGFNPASAYEVIEKIRRREEDLAAQLAADPVWLRRLDDIIEARALLWDLSEDWYSAVTDVWPRMVTIEEFGIERLHRIIRGIPIVDIESSIRRANFATGDHKWTTNDIHDMGFAGAAVTYCDVVLTERHLQTQLVHQGIDRKYKTTILSRPEDLIAHLHGSGA